jgi:hypothetical protein
MQNEIQKLLQKDMDRKNFLKHVGVGFAAIAGVTTAIKTIAMLNGSQKEVATGYGSSAYGGSSSAASKVNVPARKIQG